MSTMLFCWCLVFMLVQWELAFLVRLKSRYGCLSMQLCNAGSWVLEKALVLQ